MTTRSPSWPPRRHSTPSARAVHADGVEQERSYLPSRQTLILQFGGKLQHRSAERAWHRAKVKGEHLGPRQTIVVAPFMGQGDQLLWRAGGDSVIRQQLQKLVIRRVRVSNGS